MEQMLANKVSQAASLAGSSGTMIAASASQILYEYLEYISHAVDASLDYEELYDKFMPIAKTDNAQMIVLGTEPENAIDKEVFEKALKQENILYIGGDSVRECTVMGADGTENIKKGYVYFLDKEDIPAVYRIRNELTRNPELHRTLKLTNLSGVEAQRIHDHLTELGIHSEVYENRNHNYNLLYSANNRKAVDYAKAVTAVELSGEDGKAMGESFDYWTRQSEELEKRIYDNTQKDTFYVVNSNASLEVNKKYVVFKEGDRQAVTIPKTEENRGAVCGCFRKMGQFCVIEKEQFPAWKSGKNAFFEAAMREQGVPEQREEMKLLAGQKMANLDSILKAIDDEMTVDRRTSLLLAKDIADVVSVDNEQLKQMTDESFHKYQNFDEKDKMQTIDSTLRQALEDELEKGNSLENIAKSLEQRRDDLEKENEPITEEELENREMLNQQKDELWDEITRNWD